MFNKAFLALVNTIKEDAIKVLDDALTYLIALLCINEATGIRWEYGPEETRAYADFAAIYMDFLDKQLKERFWYDAWGDMFMENSGNFKSFRGQFFTPAAISDLCAKISGNNLLMLSGRTVINDCACGSARMLLAAEREAFSRGEPQPYLVGEDIDGICCKMAAVNLAVHGCLGEVIRHDSLKEPGELRYGYIINESLASGHKFPSIRISSNKEDFWKMRNTLQKAV